MRGLPFLCLLLLVVSSAIGGSIRGRERELKRTKREWIYPDIQTLESRDPSTFKRQRLQQVKSSDDRVVSYELRLDPSDAGMFSLDDDAVIYQEKPVDYEKKQSHMLQIIAFDKNHNQVEDTLELSVSVIDANDNYPVFDTLSLFAEVQEDNDKTKSFHNVIATDADSSRDGNNAVVYYKVTGSENPPGDVFQVGLDGSLRVKGDLDAEKTPRITFEVEAADSNGGKFGLRTTKTVTVNVLDANDHAPVFVDEPYAVAIGELTPVGHVIKTIYATDDDKGLNSEVTFDIVNGDSDGRFRMESIPSETGQSIGKVYVNKALDYENQPKEYKLTILAKNLNATNADDPTYQSTATLSIEIQDQNEKPVFLRLPYSGEVVEGLNINQTIGSVTAIDQDFGGQVVTYSIENPENWFQIDETGKITTTQAIDRENPMVIDGVYNLQIKATDEMNESAFATYRVTVLDKNDNAPVPEGAGWETSMCSSYTEENQQTPITTISAKDADSDDNAGPFVFSLQSQSHFSIELEGNASAKVFATNLKYEVGKTYHEIVTLKDAPKTGELVQTGTATLTIKVCRCEDDNTCSEKVISPGGFNYLILIGILVAILLIIIIVLAAMQYQRKRSADIQKRGLLYDEDDVREQLSPYHHEGGGEEDNNDYDMRILTQVDPNMPPVDEKPLLRAEPQARPLMDPDSNIEDYIDNAKKQADNDPTAPPFDSLLVFDYEGHGSDAGSLSSLNSGTTDGSQNYYDYLNDWGPRFNRIADVYGGDESD